MKLHQVTIDRAEKTYNNKAEAWLYGFYGGIILTLTVVSAFCALVLVLR